MSQHSNILWTLPPPIVTIIKWYGPSPSITKTLALVVIIHPVPRLGPVMSSVLLSFVSLGSFGLLPYNCDL